MPPQGQRLAQLAAQVGAINLSQGFPDFDGPDALREANLRFRRASLRVGANTGESLVVVEGSPRAPTTKLPVDAYAWVQGDAVHTVQGDPWYHEQLMDRHYRVSAGSFFQVHTAQAETLVRVALEMLAPSFEGREADLTEENLQSRIRGLTLMALSNKLGWIVLATGNKSEVAVGYATLYGDTVGGYAMLKDVYKTRVYDLCRWRNTQGDVPVIPEHVITKPPSAELRPDQRDDQSLPPYDVLDPILQGYIEHDRTVSELIAQGHDADTVRRVARLVDNSEYKRRQSPIGVKVTTKAFGKDRRLPITNGYR